MKRELAMKLAESETPDMMADRIVELYATVGELEAENRELWERLESRAVPYVCGNCGAVSYGDDGKFREVQTGGYDYPSEYSVKCVACGSESNGCLEDILPELLEENRKLWGRLTEAERLLRDRPPESADRWCEWDNQVDAFLTETQRDINITHYDTIEEVAVAVEDEFGGSCGIGAIVDFIRSLQGDPAKTPEVAITDCDVNGTGTEGEKE